MSKHIEDDYLKDLEKKMMIVSGEHLLKFVGEEWDIQAKLTRKRKRKLNKILWVFRIEY